MILNLIKLIHFYVTHIAKLKSRYPAGIAHGCIVAFKVIVLRDGVIVAQKFRSGFSHQIIFMDCFLIKTTLETS